jgi:uncharacterized protein
VKAPACLLLLALTLAGCRAAPDAANVAAGNEANPAAPEAAAPQRALPALTGRVVDMANLLTPAEEAGLTAELAALERRTTDQIVVVTAPSLEGEPIAAYARRLGNGWGIGQANKDNGVLIVVAQAEQQTRIHVGYGLEPILTNARAAEIIRRDMVPHFRESRWLAGIQGGSRAVIATLVAHEREPRRGR